MDTYCKLGDTIGYLIKGQGPTEPAPTWKLRETKVDRIALCKDGAHIHTKGLTVQLDEEIQSNTEWLLESPQLILVHEPFVLNDELRDRVEHWIQWVNSDPENEKRSSSI